jgi:hypothetical protein
MLACLVHHYFTLHHCIAFFFFSCHCTGQNPLLASHSTHCFSIHEHCMQVIANNETQLNCTLVNSTTLIHFSHFRNTGLAESAGWSENNLEANGRVVKLWRIQREAYAYAPTPPCSSNICIDTNLPQPRMNLHHSQAQNWTYISNRTA